ncbi:hypothetical protein Tco_1415014, partial [Tanacetum coccineum]
MEIVDHKIKEETDERVFSLTKGPNQESLDVFSKIAFQCVAETQAQRPTIKVVIDKLQKALNFQFQIASRNPYMLYTMTVCGVAYLIRLDNIKYYESYSVFPPNEGAELNTQSYGAHGAITTIAAAAGFLAIGHLDGSFACLLGFLDSSSP